MHWLAGAVQGRLHQSGALTLDVLAQLTHGSELLNYGYCFQRRSLPGCDRS